MLSTMGPLFQACSLQQVFEVAGLGHMLSGAGSSSSQGSSSVSWEMPLAPQRLRTASTESFRGFPGGVASDDTLAPERGSYCE
jgi:hypothetical protein